MWRIDCSEQGWTQGVQLGSYCNGQNQRRWWLRPDGRGAAGVKSLDSGNISKKVLIGFSDGLEVQSKRKKIMGNSIFFFFFLATGRIACHFLGWERV